MRKTLIVGNWKMHGSKTHSTDLIKAIIQETQALQAIEMAVCPTYVHLSIVSDLLNNTPIQLGAQNLFHIAQGAYTGEVSGEMLKDIGCHYVLVGHSERRSLFHEDLRTVANKFAAALTAKLIPILCVGETQAEHEQGLAESVVTSQLISVIDKVGIDSFVHAVVAYEPVWAIGTGLTASPEKAEAMHAFIREIFKQKKVAIAENLRILYGGSMKPDNAKALLSQPNIDGGLIGGASLHAEQFSAICEHAQSLII